MMEVLPEDVEPILTAKEAADILRIDSPKKLYDKLREDDFPSIKEDGRWLISAKNLDEYLAKKRDQNQFKKSA
jgi:hypothetical protein